MSGTIPLKSKEQSKEKVSLPRRSSLLQALFSPQPIRFALISLIFSLPHAWPLDLSISCYACYVDRR